jgi:hypothetical protein
VGCCSVMLFYRRVVISIYKLLFNERGRHCCEKTTVIQIKIDLISNL